eukprot:TRINITY_DN11895_c0_g1_i1.p1 TRINITY_DN11895_c0_g1~~TRINITY_DN11895_c0_g1_i1.p1  ORF type:complete len:382 (+),score=121.29 TRINITY_DN11895_c0_g1_i1:53-1198(+)
MTRPHMFALLCAAVLVAGAAGDAETSCEDSSADGHAHAHSHATASSGGHAHGHSHGGAGGQAEFQLFRIPEWVHEAYREDKIQVAVAGSLITSLIPILVMLMCPANPSKRVLHALLAFAAGSLMGDAMLHLIPHAMADGHGHSHSHDHSHGHSHGGASGGGQPWWAKAMEEAHCSPPHFLFLVGFMFFFFLEKIIRLNHGGAGGHSHSHAAPAGKKGAEKKGGSEGDGEVHMFAPTALLNLLADTSHNFTDGITIAAGFLHSLPVGVSTTLAVFVHEIPHEVGDYAVLIGAGWGRSGAMASQVVTGLGSLAGTLTMCYSAHLIDGAEKIVLPVSAGGFVYIAACTILPELLNATPSLGSILIEMFLFSLAVACMVGIGFLE